MTEVEKQQQLYTTAIEDDVSLKELLTPLWTRRWKIVFCTLLLTSAVVFYVSLLKPSYRATAIMHIGGNIPSKTLSINDAFNDSKSSQEQVKTQYELLKSRLFAERVIEELNLTNHPEFRGNKYKNSLPLLADGENLPIPAMSDMISAYLQRLSVSPVAGTELVKISFSSYYPELSMQVANAIGRTYVSYQDELHSESKESTSKWLIEQLQELEKKLESSELALQNFKEQEGLVDVQGVSGLISAEITELTSSALRAEKHKDDLQVTFDYIKLYKNDFNRLIDIPEINSSGSYRSLVTTKERSIRKISELSKRYGPKHPKRISAQAELDAVNSNIDEHIQHRVESIEKEFFSSQAKVVATKDRLLKAKEDFLRLSRLENKFSQLQREVETNKELYNNYLVRLKEADAMANYNANLYVRIIDKAVIPKSPFAPRKKLVVAVAFILSLIAICLYIIMRELLMDTLNSRRKLDSFHEAPILAVLPKFKTNLQESENKYKVDNRFTEAIRTLRTSLLFNSEKKPPKVIAITSSVPNEGKSTIALQLARSFSEMEKVLLIEADMRHPTLSKNLNLKAHRPGLSNLLAKTHQINECIVRDDHLKLDILTSGISPANPLAFLSMKRFDMLIKVFGNFYDRIIIETPPVNAVSDAVIISRLVESVLYVVHSSKTRREQISSGLRMLKQVRAPIEGIIINKSENIDTNKYQNKYYTKDMAKIIKLPVRKQG